MNEPQQKREKEEGRRREVKILTNAPLNLIKRGLLTLLGISL